MRSINGNGRTRKEVVELRVWRDGNGNIKKGGGCVEGLNFGRKL